MNDAPVITFEFPNWEYVVMQGRISTDAPYVDDGELKMNGSIEVLEILERGNRMDKQGAD